MVKNINKYLTELLNHNEVSEFRKELLQLHAYEQSEYFDLLTVEERKKHLKYYLQRRLHIFGAI